MKVGVLKSELHELSLSTSGKKTELIEKFKKATFDKTLLTTEATCSLAPNGFDQRARLSLLPYSEVVDEPENQDPTLFDLSQAMYRRDKARCQ